MQRNGWGCMIIRMADDADVVELWRSGGRHSFCGVFLFFHDVLFRVSFVAFGGMKIQCRKGAPFDFDFDSHLLFLTFRLSVILSSKHDYEAIVLGGEGCREVGNADRCWNFTPDRDSLYQFVLYKIGQNQNFTTRASGYWSGLAAHVSCRMVRVEISTPTSLK